MGSFILRGITTALFVTVLTLFVGILWSAVGFGGLSVSRLLDIGLLLSCLVGGYRAAKESGVWLLGGVTGAGYVIVGTLLLALFLPIRGLGFIQVLVEGALIGLVAGAFGAGKKAEVGSSWATRAARTSHPYFNPSYAGYNTDDRVSSEFEWDTEDEWKDDLSANQGAQKNPHENVDIEWPWDRDPEPNLNTTPNTNPKLTLKPNTNPKSTLNPDSDFHLNSNPNSNFNSNSNFNFNFNPFASEFADWERGKEDKAGKKKSNQEKRSSMKMSSEISRKPWWEQ